MSGHSQGVFGYAAVYVGLVALTIATIGLSFCNLGQWHSIVGMLIASAKTLLVMLFFMHLLHGSRMAWLAVAAGLFWLSILFSLTLTDYLTRAWLVY
jgi:cytochrome c oxidase subunit 4